jgi:large subunit ribosomal protein L25
METTLTANRRTDAGKGVARKLRAAGRVPGILYGAGVDPTPIDVSAQDLLHLFHGAGGTSILVDLEVDGQVHLALPREVQRDHIRGRYVHVDFLAVRRDRKVTMSVEIRETGDAPGVKEGGVIEHHLREVEIEVMPTDVPEGVTADISGLEIGDMLRVGDIVPPEGVTIITDPETPVISVITPAALRTEADLGLPGEEGVEGEAAEEEAAEAPAAEEPPAVEEGGEG